MAQKTGLSRKIRFVLRTGILIFLCSLFEISIALESNASHPNLNMGLNEEDLLSDPSAPVVLALKFVEFAGENVEQVMTNRQTKKLVGEMNSIFSTCQIQFQDEAYSFVKPEKFGLPYHLTSVAKMHEIRKPFDDPRYIVVINTGSWDHQKMGAPNAWTAMPGETPSGAVVEAPVSKFAGIVAHEIGHYLNLNHVNNKVNLMNPVIYGNSNQLSIDQCSNMRETAIRVRKLAIRQLDGGKPMVSLRAAYSG